MPDKTSPRPRLTLSPFGRALGLRSVLSACLALGGAAVAGGALWACSSAIGTGGVDPGQRTLVAVGITPINDVIEVDLNQELTRRFSVIATYSDGSSEDVTGEATLKLSNPAAGRIEGTQFFTANYTANRIEFTQVTAEITRGETTVPGVANVTVVWLRKSGPQQDFFFSLPLNGAPQMKPLDFATNIRTLDSFFAVDTTVSMRFEIEKLRDNLQSRIIPGVKTAVSDAWFGVGAVEDFPYSTTFLDYGTPGFRAGMGLPDDQPFILSQTMTADVLAAQTAVNSLLVGTTPRGNGRDLPEAQLEALYQIATGQGLTATTPPISIPANKQGIGGVAFRKGSMPVITLITDTMFHTKGEPATKCTGRSSTSGNPVDVFADYAAPVAPLTHTRTETIDALNKICAKVIGISALLTGPNAGFAADPAGLCNANRDLADTARATGTLVPPQVWDVIGRPTKCAAQKCCTGPDGASEEPGTDGLCPLVFKIYQSGDGLDTHVVTGISQLARFASFDVKTELSGVTTDQQGEISLPTGKTTADFVKSVTPVSSTAAPPAGPLTLPAPMISGSSFSKVYPGSNLQFQVTVGNDFASPIDRPQVFRATIKVLAGGCTDLDQRDVIILVPPRDPRIG